MTKTLEDLEQLTVEQLKGIAVGLGADPKANIRKPDLVQLVYDIQQPEPQAGDEDAEVAPEPKKPINTQEELDGKLQAIVDHFNGTNIEAVDEREDGVVIYAVRDELTDEEIVRGTFLALEEQTLVEFTPDNPPSLDGDTPAQEFEQPAIEEAKLETPALADDEAFQEIMEGLKPLAGLGLKHTVDGSVIKFHHGAKTVTTTLNQPAHRVVATAKQLCNFK